MKDQPAAQHDESLASGLACKCSISNNDDGKPKLPGLLKNVEQPSYEWSDGDPYEPCAGCSWTPFQAFFYKKYESNHRLFYTCHNVGVWSLGGRVIMKDRLIDETNLEVDNMKFLKEKTTVPLPRVFHDWKDPIVGRHYILQEKMEGVSLEQVWPDLEPEARERIAEQAAAYLFQLRGLTSDRVQAVTGRQCRNNGLVPAALNVLPYMSSNEEIWAAVEQALPHADSALRDRLRRAMPDAEPFTFTHGDLSIVNIMVNKDGELTGFVDFEYAGYFPSWWEMARNALWFGDEDKAWKELLCKHMKSHHRTNEVGLRWWRACRAVARAHGTEIEAQRLRELFEEES